MRALNRPKYIGFAGDPSAGQHENVGTFEAFPSDLGASMNQMKLVAVVALLSLAPYCWAQAPSTPIPSNFESTGADRQAIEALLETYTRAVSSKNQALFETLLLNKQVPFSDVYSAVRAKGTIGGTNRYEAFRRGVFDGPPFTQKFRDVHIAQDGPLAQVSLVFVNSSPKDTSWGWKTMQLLKTEGHWKIASEFYTGHD